MNILSGKQKSCLIRVISYEDFVYSDLELLDTADIIIGRSQKHKYKDILDVVCAFDIETSYIKELDESIMYIWQFAIDGKLVIYGRYWEQYVELCSIMCKICRDREARLAIYVHNLSYE